MHHGARVDPDDYFRRVGTAKRTGTLAPIVPSQDVSRYQATDMPRPTYDLNATDKPKSPIVRLILALVVAATGAAIVRIERIGGWLTR